MAFSNGPPPDFIYINFKESTVGAERGGAHFIQFLPFVDEEPEQQLAAQVTRLCSSQPRPEPGPEFLAVLVGLTISISIS